MKDKLLLTLLFSLLTATVLLYGAEDSTQLKTTVISALEFFKTGNYSCDFLIEHHSNSMPSEKLKMLHISDEQYGEMIRWEPDEPTGGNVFPVIGRDGKFNKVINGKVYAISLQNPQYNPLVSLRQAFEGLQLMLEKFPLEYRQKAIQCDGKPGFRITVNFPKGITTEQLDTLQSFFPQATPEDFKDFGTMVFNVGKQNGFLYRIECYDANGKRKDDTLSFSKVKINPEWSLDDFTLPTDLEVVEISTEKQFDKAFKTSAKPPRKPLGVWLSIHRTKIVRILTRLFWSTGLLLLLGVLVIYFRRKGH
ncbi:MAG: hypothetical protein IKR13_05315 [Victivallales bacterium]|nr:hypothetical protein [Victivallales bacterium]